MKNVNFIGRQEEFKKLEKCYNEKQSQLVIVSGRRRVGKTFLVNEVFEGDFVFKLTGARDLSVKDQLLNFSNELKRRTGKKQSPKSWNDAFELLRVYLDSFDSSRRLVVFFDEMPWLDTKKSKFLENFEYFWNDYGSAKKNLMFIVCGSAASWLQDKIMNNKGGLFDRHSAFITLKPFTLKETEKYLESKNIIWTREDIVRLYMILGGIPYYLNYLDCELTLSENIDSMFFASDATLKNEFELLYSTLFENKEAILKIVETLSKNRYGMSRKDISNVSKIQYNGALTNMLKSLEVSGFIESFVRYGDKKETCYRLCDYYSIFYLKFIKDSKNNDHHFWSNSYANQARKNYEALGFELICLNQIDKIKSALSIGGVLSNNYPWLKQGTNDDDGAQIDLVIERKDHVTSICEIKFYDDSFEIDKEYAQKLRKKIDIFIRTTNCKNSIQLILISSYGLKKNMYSNMINKVVCIDDMF